MNSLSVIIPVFNSEEIIKELARRLISVLEAYSEKFEVILVDDCSQDGSWEKVLEICSEDKRFRGVRLSRNFGQHNALLCGIRLAKNEIIITMDDDLQNPPEEIPRLLEKLGKGYDVVYGVPIKMSHGLWRIVSSTITKMVLGSVMGVKTAKDVSAFRAFYAWIRNAFSGYKNPYVSIDVLLTHGTSRFSSVSVRNDPRSKGVSTYTFKKLVIHALNMITGFSTIPLRIASIVGFLFTMFGLLVLAFVLTRYFIVGGTVPGFPFLASVISIFSGAQLFALGIMGEYLSRIHQLTMDKPPYLILSEAISGRNNDDD